MVLIYTMDLAGLCICFINSDTYSTVLLKCVDFCAFQVYNKTEIDKKMYNALMGVVHFLYHMVILIVR